MPYFARRSDGAPSPGKLWQDQSGLWKFRVLKDVVYGEVDVQKFQKAMEGGIVHYPFRCRHLKLGLSTTGDP
jgi:hypothetical protein